MEFLVLVDKLENLLKEKNMKVEDLALLKKKIERMEERYGKIN